MVYKIIRLVCNSKGEMRNTLKLGMLAIIITPSTKIIAKMSSAKDGKRYVLELTALLSYTIR